MAITAYSKFFDNEYDLDQLEDHFQKSKFKAQGTFSEFINIDVRCALCGCKGASAVREGISKKLGAMVSQKHFAFKNSDGRNSHNKYCTDYESSNSLIVPTENYDIDYAKSRSAATSEIRRMVCIALENGMVTKKHMREMRKWFLDAMTNNEITLQINRHLPNILHAEMSEITESNCHIKETYILLSEKLSILKKSGLKRSISGLLRKSTLDRINVMIKSHEGCSTFDRRPLERNYKLSTQLRLHILGENEVLSNKLQSVNCKRLLDAFSALLLFTSNWCLDDARSLYDKISSIECAKNETLGNAIGLNPFVKMEDWLIISHINEVLTPDDLDDLFVSETNHVLTYKVPF
jgi:hypothetical protein